jgi:predicted nucleic acid-binding protein
MMASQPTQIPAILDASFWINIVRMDLASHLVDYFVLYVPPRVTQELAAPLGRSQIPQPAALFQEWTQRQLVHVEYPNLTFGRFDAGENEAIALALERDWALLIDNSAPRDWSRGRLHLRVIDSPAFAVFLYDQWRIEYPDAVAALARSQAARRVVREALIVLVDLAKRRGDIT